MGVYRNRGTGVGGYCRGGRRANEFKFSDRAKTTTSFETHKNKHSVEREEPTRQDTQCVFVREAQEHNEHGHYIHISGTERTQHNKRKPLATKHWRKGGCQPTYHTLKCQGRIKSTEESCRGGGTGAASEPRLEQSPGRPRVPTTQNRRS